MDNEFRKKVTPELTRYEVVEEFSPDVRVYRMTMSMPFPLNERDVVFLFCRRKNDDGSYSFCGCSVEHPKAPEEKSAVRAYQVLTIGKLVPTSEGKTLVYNLQQYDPRGNVPTFVVNWMLSQQVKEMTNMAKYLPEWRKPE
eukprot:TRINITY_DN4241_c0_g1_i1.p2 TRINITY_DN4241_c0_g1~~TRINITY_DN4241_c0_g1_i1.p2  ORF type:complete len:141 (-),score=46.99 TRINITY_DN4241_c0_g1_i1:92-514(-)